MRDKSWSSIGGNKIHAVKYLTNRIENKIKQQETNKNQQFWNQNPYIEKAETAYKKKITLGTVVDPTFSRDSVLGDVDVDVDPWMSVMATSSDVIMFEGILICEKFKIQNSKPIKMNILMQFNNKKGKKLIRIPCSMKQKESICL